MIKKFEELETKLKTIFRLIVRLLERKNIQ